MLLLLLFLCIVAWREGLGDDEGDARKEESENPPDMDTGTCPAVFIGSKTGVFLGESKCEIVVSAELSCDVFLGDEGDT